MTKAIHPKAVTKAGSYLSSPAIHPIVVTKVMAMPAMAVRLQPRPLPRLRVVYALYQRLDAGRIGRLLRPAFMVPVVVNSRSQLPQRNHQFGVFTAVRCPIN